MKRPKLSARTTPKLTAWRFQSSADVIAGSGKADEAEAADGHPFTRLAERLGEHGGDARGGHAQDRDDGGERGR